MVATTHQLLLQVPERPLLEVLQQQNLHRPEQEDQPNPEHRHWPIPKILTRVLHLLLRKPHHKEDLLVLLDNQVKQEQQDNQVLLVQVDNQVKQEQQVLQDNQVLLVQVVLLVLVVMLVLVVLLDNQVHLKLNLNLLPLDQQILKHLPTTHSMPKHRKP